jgi:hypothetical protein
MLHGCSYRLVCPLARCSSRANGTKSSVPAAATKPCIASTGQVPCQKLTCRQAQHDDTKGLACSETPTLTLYGHRETYKPWYYKWLTAPAYHTKTLAQLLPSCPCLFHIKWYSKWLGAPVDHIQTLAQLLPSCPCLSSSTGMKQAVAPAQSKQ